MTSPRTLNVAGTLLPLALVLVYPSLSAALFSGHTFPLFFAPWVCRASLSAVASRIIQTGIIFRSHNNLVIAHAYALWFAIAGVRTLTGWVLTRAVGWAYPAFFSHSSLYESVSGLGPSLLAFSVLNGVRSGWPEPPTHRSKLVEPLVVGAICAVLTWLDDAPWTYAVAILLVLPIALIRSLLPATTMAEKSQLLPAPTMTKKNAPRARGIALSMLACLGAITIPRLRPTPRSVVAFPSDPTPLLDILVLSYPRPHDNPVSTILNTTISSLLPLTLVPGITVSVFTHAQLDTHTAFVSARTYFAEIEAEVAFHEDTDRHADAVAGQHLHVAEALRWASTRPTHGAAERAEWVMLLEDDFPLCGTQGMEDLARVMQELERGRTTDYLERRGAFVGTGGSGLIFHHTLLPILSTLLKLHANTESALPVDVVRRPADLIMQDCLLGTDPLCPRRTEVINLHATSTFSTTSASTSVGVSSPEGGNLVITSRLIIDHIGGVASTTPGRTYGNEKWRCGWRHPFHGRDEVDVVVV
ncbi:hypothetical protein B0H11DRAFT_1993593 [Mycena galericulata]|nr:hypothetical protein B0H11DRAFT_1993593 [Mycena galericulata]